MNEENTTLLIASAGSLAVGATITHLYHKYWETKAKKTFAQIETRSKVLMDIFTWMAEAMEDPCIDGDTFQEQLRQRLSFLEIVVEEG
jgi:pantothenate kinase